MGYDEFATALKECMVSLWVDDESTFGTFPLESMKCGVPVVGKIPDTEPDWLSENGMWTYDGNKLVELYPDLQTKSRLYLARGYDSIALDTFINLSELHNLSLINNK